MRTIRWPAGTYAIVGQLLDRNLRVVEETEPQEFQLVCGDPAWTEC